MDKQVQIPTQSAHLITAMLHNAFKTDLLPLLAVIVIAWLAHPFVLPVGKSHCAMTYMYPSYIDVSNVAGTHPLYNLYLYREGRPFYHDARDAMRHATGVPTLFLHGSGGSYKQVRSLASETARQTEASGQPSLAWFAADYQEELSAFDGLLLERQTTYAVACIKWLRQEYMDKQQRSVPIVLVGHSMGGIVARAAAVAIKSDAATRGSILAIVTLAAPHQQPPANVQAPMHAFYTYLQHSAVAAGHVDKVSDRLARPGGTRVPLLSVAGGTRDLLVLPELNALVGVWPEDITVEADVRDMPGVWLSADHQSMVWCNELVVLLANLLQTIAQTETLKLHNQGLAQQHIVQQMQDATQPKIASTLGWLQTSNRLSTLAANDNLQKQRSAASTCSEQHSGIESGQQVTDGQLLVINQMSGQQCSDRGFRVFRHLNSTTAGIAAPAEVTHAAVQLLSSIKGSRGEAASSEAESQQRKPTWLLSLKTEKAVSLWVGKDAEVELTAEASPKKALQPSLWQLMFEGYRIIPKHATAMHIQLPSLTHNLQGLGLKLTAFSTSVKHKHTSRSADVMASDSVPKAIESSDASIAGSQEHEGICSQPVLVAHGAGSNSGGQVVREVVRRGPAELSLWATEALDKHIGVISDPSCELTLRLEWDIQRAARNALRLHAASLPALACALLLLRLAVLTCLTTCLSSRLTSHLFPVSNSASHHADRHPLQPQAHSKHCTPAFKSNLKVPRGALYYAMFMWAATASWLWPQLAIAAGWMSHRRPSLPSVTWSCFLLLLAEGLLEAFERVADLVAWCGKQLPCVQGGSVPGALVHMKIRDTPSWLRVSVTCAVIAAVTLAAARVQPMLALLQALLCHSWVAYQARHRRCTLPSLETSSSQTGNSKHTCCTCLPDKDGPQQQQSGGVQHQLCEPIQSHQQAPNQQTSSQQQQSHQLQQHACLLDNNRTQTCVDGSQQQHCQQHQQQQSCLQHDHQRQPVYTEQEDQAYMRRALQPDMAQQIAAELPTCMCQLERHEIHIKIVVCCILLQALPFVAWVKQPRHSQQFAAWSDAMPYAIMAMHGAVLAILDPWRSPRTGASQGAKAHRPSLVTACAVCWSLFTVSVFVAVSALHDQPFTASHGFAAFSMFAAAVTLWSATNSVTQTNGGRNLHD